MKNSTIKKSYKIIDLIKMVTSDSFVLPEIQREFVWELNRVAELWDSIYRGFPIGQLLFWTADTSIPTYSFFDQPDKNNGQYLFIGNRPHWTHQIRKNNRNKTIVLDGQQRLTSLLLGVLADGVTLKRRKNSAPERRYLCIYIGKEDIDGDNDVKLFDWRKVDEDADYISLSKALASRKQNPHIRTLKNRLWSSATAVPVDYVLGSNESDVVEIFRRLNNNGRNMNKSELFLAMWFGNTNAANIRDELVELRKSFGANFEVNDSTITQLLKTIFSVHDNERSKATYPPELFHNITKNLPKLKRSVRFTVSFLENECGIYSNSEMSSHGLFIPIVYIFYKNNCALSEKLKQELRCFVYRSLVFDLFASSTNSVLANVKKRIDEMKGDNLIESLSQSDIIGGKCFGDYKDRKAQWLEGEVNGLMERSKGSKTNQVLLLLRKDKANTFDSDSFDQDHLIAGDLFHPTTAKALRSDNHGKFGIRKKGGLPREEYMLTKAELKKWGKISSRKENRERANRLPNLWLLESSENRKKGKKLLNIWFSELDEKSQKAFLSESLLPKTWTAEDLKITNFNMIYRTREDIMERALNTLLALPKNN